ncbi:monovalent cation/H(+) antiporter subunit G [Chelativorans sp. Marseille-P2723]|uniref:monovalent cation/H(+) antiporter subunit G n=1 Tax=Chelativorans sp. Marseille-P2723 TaxID=2709133 RepID=UPI00156DCC35|nr:monovalent cation/H(+) antiporter subunit G [Chelativorans sp. Marseille-P2723]
MDFSAVPLWAAILGSAFLLLGAGLSLIGTFGLVRLQTFYERIHAPTLGTSWGTAGMVMGSMIIFSAATGRPVLHHILIGIFVTVTTPITLMMLGRATLYRDRSEGNSSPLVKGDQALLQEQNSEGGAS